MQEWSREREHMNASSTVQPSYSFRSFRFASPDATLLTQTRSARTRSPLHSLQTLHSFYSIAPLAHSLLILDVVVWLWLIETNKRIGTVGVNCSISSIAYESSRPSANSCFLQLGGLIARMAPPFSRWSVISYRNVE